MEVKGGLRDGLRVNPRLRDGDGALVLGYNPSRTADAPDPAARDAEHHAFGRVGKMGCLGQYVGS